MHMKRYLILAIALIVLSGTAFAQDDYPKAEVFAGYAYLRTAGNTNVNGWNGQAVFNMNHWFGVAADIAGHYQTKSDDDLRPSASIHSFMFGPHLADRAGRITGFAHALFGIAHAKEGFNLGRGGLASSSNNLAIAFGGGVDANINDVFAVRLFQADYLNLRVEDPLTGDKKGRNNFRLSIGLVFKIQ